MLSCPVMIEEIRPDAHTRVLAFGQTDPGRVRTNNEDAFLITPLSGVEASTTPFKASSFDASQGAVLLAVSDGMGGAAAGEVASALAIETLRRAMAEARGASWDEATLEAVKSANREVWNAAHEPGRRGMGATLTAVCVHEQQAYIAAVGDSRAYLLRGGRIRQMTRDQSFVQFMIDSGALKPEAAAKFPMKNIVLQAMGQRPEVEVALGRLDLRNGDVLLLCSDGLSNKLEADEMRMLIETAPTLAAACNEMIALANSRGGDDNVTVVLARLEGERLQMPVDGESMTTTFRVLAEYRADAAAGGLFTPDTTGADDDEEDAPPLLLPPAASPPPAASLPPPAVAPASPAPSPRVRWPVLAGIVLLVALLTAALLSKRLQPGRLQRVEAGPRLLKVQHHVAGLVLAVERPGVDDPGAPASHPADHPIHRLVGVPVDDQIKFTPEQQLLQHFVLLQHPPVVVRLHPRHIVAAEAMAEQQLSRRGGDGARGREPPQVGLGRGGQILQPVRVGQGPSAVVEDPALVVASHAEDPVALQQLDAAVHVALAVHHVPHRQDLLDTLAQERLNGPLQQHVFRVDISDKPELSRGWHASVSAYVARRQRVTRALPAAEGPAVLLHLGGPLGAGAVLPGLAPEQAPPIPAPIGVTIDLAQGGMEDRAPGAEAPGVLPGQPRRGPREGVLVVGLGGEVGGGQGGRGRGRLGDRFRLGSGAGTGGRGCGGGRGGGGGGLGRGGGSGGRGRGGVRAAPLSGVGSRRARAAARPSPGVSWAGMRAAFPWRCCVGSPPVLLPLLAAISLVGCKGSVPPNPPAGGTASLPTAPPRTTAMTSSSPPSPAAPEPKVLRGKLRFQEIPPVKSVQAYDGVEFTLLTPEGESLPLAPGASVPRERLRALDGKEVSLRVRLVEPPPPSPWEQAPMGPDGKAQRRTPRHEVLEVLGG
jgi:serine/threonine protein phosphatase PrpC